MSKSNYLENAFLNHTLTNTAYASPASVFMALSTADPTEDGSGLAEPVGNGYTRQSVTFSASTTGSSSNTNTVSYTASGGAWGTITHFAIMDAVSGGNALYYAPLNSARVISDGSSASFAAGSVVINED